MNIIVKKILLNGRLWSAVVSAIGAIVSALCAGCRLYLGEMQVSELECSIGVGTNTVQEVK